MPGRSFHANVLKKKLQYLNLSSELLQVLPHFPSSEGSQVLRAKEVIYSEPSSYSLRCCNILFRCFAPVGYNKAVSRFIPDGQARGLYLNLAPTCFKRRGLIRHELGKNSYFGDCLTQRATHI